MGILAPTPKPLFCLNRSRIKCKTLSNTVTSFELRFGNLIKYDDEIVQVYGVKGIYVIIGGKETCKLSEIAFSAFEPIPITPGILKKCGFEKHRSSDKVVDLYFIGFNPVTSDHLLVLTWVIGYKLPFYMNRHFALTGKELDIRLI
jgi:hypothetical protein